VSHFVSGDDGTSGLGLADCVCVALGLRNVFITAMVSFVGMHLVRSSTEEEMIFNKARTYIFGDVVKKHRRMPYEL
jgi:hypothetical protein